MGCWGTGIACDDSFWDLRSDLQFKLHWDKYDGNPETQITAQHFNEHYHMIELKVKQGFSSNYETCWFQMLAHLVMEIGADMNEEMRNQCILACREENDYLDPSGWQSSTKVEERKQALQEFSNKINEYYNRRH